MIDATTSLLFFGVPLSAVAFTYVAVRLHERASARVAYPPLAPDAQNVMATLDRLVAASNEGKVLNTEAEVYFRAGASWERQRAADQSKRMARE